MWVSDDWRQRARARDMEERNVFRIYAADYFRCFEISAANRTPYVMWCALNWKSMAARLTTVPHWTLPLNYHADGDSKWSWIFITSSFTHIRAITHSVCVFCAQNACCFGAFYWRFCAYFTCGPPGWYTQINGQKITRTRQSVSCAVLFHSSAIFLWWIRFEFLNMHAFERHDKLVGLFVANVQEKWMQGIRMSMLSAHAFDVIYCKRLVPFFLCISASWLQRNDLPKEMWKMLWCSA